MIICTLACIVLAQLSCLALCHHSAHTSIVGGRCGIDWFDEIEAQVDVKCVGLLLPPVPGMASSMDHQR